MNTRQLINYWFYISLEKLIILRMLRWCENHVFYYFLFIEPQVSLDLIRTFFIMRALLNSLCNIFLLFYIMFYLSLENRWYQGCYGGMKIMCFYFVIINLKGSLNLKMFFY